MKATCVTLSEEVVLKAKNQPYNLSAYIRKLISEDVKDHHRLTYSFLVNETLLALCPNLQYEESTLLKDPYIHTLLKMLNNYNCGNYSVISVSKHAERFILNTHRCENDVYNEGGCEAAAIFNAIVNRILYQEGR